MNYSFIIMCLQVALPLDDLQLKHQEVVYCRYEKTYIKHLSLPFHLRYIKHLSLPFHLRYIKYLLLPFHLRYIKHLLKEVILQTIYCKTIVFARSSLTV